MEPIPNAHQLQQRECVTSSQIIRFLSKDKIKVRTFYCLKEKMLVKSIFFFSHSVLFSFQNNIQFLCHIFLSSANALNFDLNKTLLFGNELQKNM